MEVARFWRTTNQRCQMIGEVCENCGSKMILPRPVCLTCEREKADAIDVFAQAVAKRDNQALVEIKERQLVLVK